jgi:short-subunit dehydrogenase
MKKIFITGVSSGLGFELCKQLLAQGNIVYGVSRREVLAQEISDESFSGKFIWQPCDVTRFDDIQRIIEHQRSIGFSPDVVILNSGAHFNEDNDFVYEDYEKLFKVNCAGSLGWVEAYLPEFKNRERGQFVYISSLAACFPFPFRGAYSASKAYTSMVFKCLQKQFAGLGVGFTIIYAGLLDTKMSSKVKVPCFFKYPISKAAEVVLQTVKDGNNCKYSSLRMVFLECFLALLPIGILLKLLGNRLRKVKKKEA